MNFKISKSWEFSNSGWNSKIPLNLSKPRQKFQNTAKKYKIPSKISKYHQNFKIPLKKFKNPPKISKYRQKNFKMHILWEIFKNPKFKGQFRKNKIFTFLANFSPHIYSTVQIDIIYDHTLKFLPKILKKKIRYKLF